MNVERQKPGRGTVAGDLDAARELIDGKRLRPGWRGRRCGAGPPDRRPGKLSGMERVLGIGGYFLRAEDPAAL